MKKLEGEREQARMIVLLHFWKGEAGKVPAACRERARKSKDDNLSVSCSHRVYRAIIRINGQKPSTCAGCGVVCTCVSSKRVNQQFLSSFSRGFAVVTRERCNLATHPYK